MEPRIQYAKTEDGVNIAYATEGEGPPLVWLLVSNASHAQRVWGMFPNILPPLARAFRLTWYDPRGTGLSDRDAIDFSMEAMMRDLDAVVERTGLQSFAVGAYYGSAAVAVTYAATFPDRVSHLILIDGWTNWSDVAGTPAWETLEALIDQDWTLFTETMARVLLGMDDPQLIEVFGEYMRGCIEPEAWRAYNSALQSWDVAELLPNVRAKTLVLQNNDSPWAPIRAGQKLAAGIPDARFLTIDDVNFEHAAPLIEAFVGSTGKTHPVEPQQVELPQGTAIILFLDIADSTALTTKLGDAAYREKERELDGELRAAITEAGGTPVEGKVLGDGIMSVYTSARQAIEAAQRCRDLGNEAGLPLHLGIHAGDVVREVASDGRANVHGGAVQVAARVVDAAEPGEILVSATVRDLARTSAGVAFEDRGEHEMKGIAEPQRLFAVREQA